MSLFSLFKKTDTQEISRSRADEIVIKHNDQHKRAMDKILEIFTAVLKGDMEARILHISEYDKDIQDTFIALNNFIDMTDAYIRETSATMEHACEKKYYREFLETGFTGSFRRGAGILNRTRENMQQMEKDARRATLDMATQFEGHISSVVEALSASASQLGGASGQMSDMAQNTFLQSGEVATATNDANENVGAVASATEELSSSINEISQQMEASSTVTREAVEGAQNASEAVVGLETSANEIDKVVELIRSIAGQTNLLALNATIEAARAGEAGKGFAVVASEVKSLANETSKATDDIVIQVESIQNAIQLTVKSIGEISAKIDQVNQYTSSISATVTQQNVATQEISRNVQQASSGTQKASDNVVKIKETSEITTRMAKEVNSASDEVSEQISVLEKEVESFLSNIRND